MPHRLCRVGPLNPTIKDTVSARETTRAAWAISAPFLAQECHRFHLFSSLLYPEWFLALFSMIHCFERSINVVSVIEVKSMRSPWLWQLQLLARSFVSLLPIKSWSWENVVGCARPSERTMLPSVLCAHYRLPHCWKQVSVCSWKRKDMLALLLWFLHSRLLAAVMEVAKANWSQATQVSCLELFAYTWNSLNCGRSRLLSQCNNVPLKIVVHTSRRALKKKKNMMLMPPSSGTVTTK